MLNSDYTFETLSVGQSNRDAYEAALSIIKSPGKIYNPLLIYGGAKVGKTHLLQAIGNAIEKEHPKLTVLYVTGSEFIVHFRDVRVPIEVLRTQSSDFDVLLIDDFDKLITNETATEEFKQLFKILYESQRQIVISMNDSCWTQETIYSRFYDYFKPGVSVRINPPDCDIRASMIRNMIKNESWKMNDEAIQYLASSIPNPFLLDLTILQLVLLCKINNIFRNYS